MIENPTAVIFDMDGVLIDSGAHHRAAWRDVLDELGVTPARPDYWRLTIGRPGHEAVPLLLGREVDWWEARHLAGRKQAYYIRRARAGLPAILGAPAFVETLLAHGVPLAVATSAARRDAERLLANLDLLRHFPVMVTADEVRLGKPNPEVYLRAADGIGVLPTECLVFEDSVVGVHAAREAGMTVIGVATAHTAEELVAAGATRAIADFEGATWPM